MVIVGLAKGIAIYGLVIAIILIEGIVIAELVLFANGRLMGGVVVLGEAVRVEGFAGQEPR